MHVCVLACSGPSVPPSPAKRLQHLQANQAHLRNMLRTHIGIAQRYNLSLEQPEASWAWDVVEEISTKLHDVEYALAVLKAGPLSRIEDSDDDMELARREYDL